MNVQDVLIDEIKVGKRRREVFNNIDLLADSINRLGLFHPIVIDKDFNLVAGERRLRAFKFLGRTEIPARIYEDLTEQEHWEIELEENTQREKLSDIERDKQLVAEAEKVAPIISDKLSEKKKGEKRGRKSHLDAPKEEVAKALGVSDATLRRAERHVEAIDKYPELSNIPTQQDVLTVTKNLDKLSEPERKEKLEALANNDQTVLASLAEKAPPAKRAKKTPGEKWTAVVYEIRKMFASIHSLGGVDELTKSWSAREKETYLTYVREMIDELRQIETRLKRTTHDRPAKRKVDAAVSSIN